MKKFEMYLIYFFTYEDDLPAEVGFRLFDASHILWLLFCGLLIVCGVCLYKKLPGSKRKTVEHAIGISTVILLSVRILVLSLLGYMSVYELPLHLCSMAGLLCGLHVFAKWDWLGQVLYTLCLPGAALALLFPNGVYYPAVSFITIQSFLFHTGIILYILCQLAGGGIKPRLRAVWKPLLFLLITVPPVYLFNLRFHTNYMFLNIPAKGSPLEWLASSLGNNGYLPGYAALALVVMLLMDAGYWLFHPRPRMAGRYSEKIMS